MRFVRRDVRDLIARQKNDHGASYWRHRVLRRRSCLKFDFREIFGVLQFSTFATKSPQQRTYRNCIGTSVSCLPLTDTSCDFATKGSWTTLVRQF